MTNPQDSTVLHAAIDAVFGSRSQVEALNGERALQCALYAALRQRLPSDLTILVEPTVVSPEAPTVLGARPDILVVELPHGSRNSGRIRFGLELKFKPWGHVVFEDDLEQLVEYRKSSHLRLKFGIDLDGAIERIADFSVDPDFSRWVFVAVGQSDSVVSSADEMYAKIPTAKDILAACLVAKSGRDTSITGPRYWIGELGGLIETKSCAAQ